jgi:Cys-rich repeat protein
MNRVLRRVFIVWGLALWAGCGGGIESSSAPEPAAMTTHDPAAHIVCSAGDPCPAGFVCVSRIRCAKECTTDSECPAGQTCRGNLHGQRFCSP